MLDAYTLQENRASRRTLVHSGSDWIKWLHSRTKALLVDAENEESMDMDVDESEDELSFVPNAVDFVRWCTPRF